MMNMKEKMTWRPFRIFFIFSSVSGVGKGRRSSRRNGGGSFYWEIEKGGF